MISTQLPYRYAVYFCPAPHTNWGLAGAQWIGRCAITGKKYQEFSALGIEPELFSLLTSDPKRYGWHATLKAPFKLMPNHEVGDLLLKMHQLAKSLKPFDLPKLEVSTAGGFLSLRPGEVSDPLHAAASMCVRDLHSFALPLDDAELARRRKAKLTPEQDELLVQWGYPWVLDQFHFHFSLTGSLHSIDLPTQQKLMQAAQQHFGHLSLCRFDRIALVTEPQAGKDFEVIKLLELCP